MKFINKRDIFIVFGILFVAGAFFVFRSDSVGAYAALELDGEIVKTMPLNRDGIFHFNDEISFEVRDNMVAFHKNNCPDQVCVRTGFINHPFELSVCLPHRLILTIRGVETDIDFFLN